MTPAGKIALAAGALGLLGLYLLWTAISALLRRQRMISTPTSKIADRPTGFAELHGRIVALEELRAPYSQERCVYYSFRLMELQRQNRGKRWVVRRKGSEFVDFVIDDGTGRALVRPKGATFELNEDARARTGTFSGLTPELRAFLTKLDVDPTTFLGFNRELRLEESFLAPDDELYLLGRVRGCGSGEGKRAGGATLVMAEGGPDFLLSDRGEEALASSLLGRAMFGGLGALLAFGGAAAFVLLGPGKFD